MLGRKIRLRHSFFSPLREPSLENIPKTPGTRIPVSLRFREFVIHCRGTLMGLGRQMREREAHQRLFLYCYGRNRRDKVYRERKTRLLRPATTHSATTDRRDGNTDFSAKPSRGEQLRRELWTVIHRQFDNQRTQFPDLFIKKLTRPRVVPTISARVS
jgi:hypothetical protein